MIENVRSRAMGDFLYVKGDPPYASCASKF
jgi:hypothetical protein